MNRQAPLPIPPQALSEGLIDLFRDLQDTLFWVKNRSLEIIALNPAFAERVNMPEAEILGKTDAELYFPELARSFMADDRSVIETGLPIHRKFELLANRFGGVDWRSTTKLPLADRSGNICGTTGISRPLDTGGEPLPAPYAAFARIVEFARDNLAEGMDVPAIAQHAGMSVATLTRRFRSHMRLSPGEFLAQLRISKACRLLSDSPMSVIEVAIECGYDSPSAFTRAFRRQMKMAPTRYRQQIRGKDLSVPGPPAVPD